ncbi:hypothetical protein [Brevundimonas nasdae]|nr:hypothetical protein [Brevundimonas nasdae]
MVEAPSGMGSSWAAAAAAGPSQATTIAAALMSREAAELQVWGIA